MRDSDGGLGAQQRRAGRDPAGQGQGDFSSGERRRGPVTLAVDMEEAHNGGKALNDGGPIHLGQRSGDEGSLEKGLSWRIFPVGVKQENDFFIRWIINSGSPEGKFENCESSLPP